MKDILIKKLESKVSQLNNKKIDDEQEIFINKNPNELMIDDSYNENKILINQKINQELEQNLKDWQLSNQNIEETILCEQNLNTNLIQNLNEWQLANSKTEKSLSILKEQYNALQIEFENLNIAMKSSNEEKNRLEDQILKITENIKSTEEIKSDINEKLHNLEKEVDVLKCEIEALVNKKQEYEESVLDLKKLNDDLATNLNEWELSNKNIEEIIISSQELNTNLTQNLNEWQLSNEQTELNILSLKEKFEEMQSELNDLNSVHLNSQERLNQIKIDNQNLEKTIIDAQNLNGMLMQNLADWKESNSQIEKSIYEEQNQDQLMQSNIQTVQRDSFKLIGIEPQFEQIQSSSIVSNTHEMVENELCQQEPQIEQAYLVQSNDQPNTGLLGELNLNVNNLQDELSQLNLSNNFLAEENKNLNTKINELIEEKNNLDSDLFKLDTAKLQSECDMIALKNEMDILEQTKNNLTKQLEEKMTVEQDLIDELEQIKKTKHSLEVKLQSFGDNQSLQTDLHELELNMDQMVVKKNVIKKEVQLIEMEIKNHEEQILGLQELNKTLIENLVNWKETNETLQNSIIELESFNKSLSENLTEWQNANQLLEQEILNLQSQNQQLNDIYQSNTNNNLLNANLSNQIEEKISNDIDTMNDQLEDLKSRFMATEEVKQSLQVQNMDLLAEVDSLKIEKDEIESTLNQLKEDNKKINSETDIKVSEMLTKIDSLNSQLDDLNKILFSTQDAQKALETTNIDLLVEVDTLRIQKDEFLKKINEFNQKDDKIIELMAETYSLKAENEKITKELNENYLQANSILKIEEEKNELKSQLVSLDQSNKFLQIQNMDLLAEVDSLKIEKEEFGKSFNRIETEVSKLNKITAEKLSLLLHDRKINNLNEKMTKSSKETDFFKFEDKHFIDKETNNINIQVVSEINTIENLDVFETKFHEANFIKIQNSDDFAKVITLQIEKEELEINENLFEKCTNTNEKESKTSKILEEIDIFNKKFENLNSRFLSSEEAKESMQIHHMDLLSELDSLKIEKDEIYSTLNQLKEEINLKDLKLCNVLAEIHLTKSENEKLYFELNNINLVNNSKIKLEEELEELKINHFLTKQANESFKVQNIELMTKIDMLNNEKDEIEMILNKLKKEKESKLLEFKALQNQLKDLKTKLISFEEMTSELDTLKKERAEIEIREFDDLKILKINDGTKKNNQMINLNSTLSEMRIKTDSLKSENERLTVELSNVYLQMESREKIEEEFRRKNIELFAEIGTLKAEIGRLNNQIAQPFDYSILQFFKNDNIEEPNDQNIVKLNNVTLQNEINMSAIASPAVYMENLNKHLRDQIEKLFLDLNNIEEIGQELFDQKLQISTELDLVKTDKEKIFDEMLSLKQNLSFFESSNRKHEFDYQELLKLFQESNKESTESLLIKSKLIDELNNSISALNETNKTMSIELESNKLNLEDQLNRIEQLNNQIVILNKTIVKLNDDAANQSQIILDFQSSESKLSAKVEMLEKERILFEQLTSQLQIAQQNEEKCAASILNEDSSDAQMRKTKNFKFSNPKKFKKSRVHELENQLDQLKCEIISYKNSINIFKIDMDLLKEKNASLMNELASSKTNPCVQTKTNSNEKLVDMLNNKIKILEERSQEIVELNLIENTRLKIENKELKTQCSNVEFLKTLHRRTIEIYQNLQLSQRCLIEKLSIQSHNGQLDSLKGAYQELYHLYMKSRKTHFAVYNKLHDKYIHILNEAVKQDV